MELVKSAGKRTSFVSDVLYVCFNIALAATVLSLVVFGVPLIAYTLVILSKWRVLAVRPRFWWANIKANLLDLLLGLSMVTMMWQAQDVLWLQIVVAVLYMLWLVALKPRSTQTAVLVQAAVAQFMAIIALYSVGFDLIASVIVVCMWVIGYVSAQHVLSSYEDSDVTLLSMIWGLVVAELGWLAYNWTVAYAVAPGGILKVPQIAVVITLIGFFVIRAYGIYAKKGRLRLADVKLQAIFSASIIVVVLIFLNDISRG